MTPQHFLFDGDAVGVPTEQALQALLQALVSATHLTPISPLYSQVDKGGWQAFVMIAESHISVHGRERRAWVDVFSCQRFDAKLIYRLLGSGLGGRWSYTEVKRKV